MAKKLSEQEVERIALLSRLSLSEAEIALYSKQLSEVLEYVSKLASLSTEEVPALAHAAGIYR